MEGVKSKIGKDRDLTGKSLFLAGRCHFWTLEIRALQGSVSGLSAKTRLRRVLMESSEKKCCSMMRLQIIFGLHNR